MPLATSDGVEPLWDSFIPRIYEPINSVNNLPTNSQTPVTPAQDRQSTPGPIGIIPNMSALSRAASSASRDFSPPGSIFDVAVRPYPGSHVAWAIMPESSSEGHSSLLGGSAAADYGADMETFEPLSAPSERSGAFASTATTEQTFHTAPARHEHRRALSPTQRLSAIEPIRTPRKFGSESADTF